MAKITSLLCVRLATPLLVVLLMGGFLCRLSWATVESSKIQYFPSDNITNQIPYFDNRFSIDAQVEELTLLFYRKRGSEPIILVRPDGSKLRINNLPEDKVEWFDDSTYDMIKIKNPMPGPWQAIGRILPNSQILVVSDVRIEVEPLPEVILAGETLKMTGQLFNADKAIDNPLFREVISLHVDFYSTNNPEQQNFGASTIQLTTFRDDGHDLDEFAGDNIFTGEFELDFSPGEWQPVYVIKLPMATRELRQTPIVLQETPVSLSVEVADNEGEFHQLHLTIDSTHVDVDSMIFQGKITFPDRQVAPFSIMDATGDRRTHNIEYTEPGIYRVNVNAFGKTIHGREFRLLVKEFSFHAEHKTQALLEQVRGKDITQEQDKPTDPAENNVEQQRLAKAEQAALALKQARVDFEKQQAAQQQQTFILITVANVVLLLLALSFYWYIRRKKN